MLMRKKYSLGFFVILVSLSLLSITSQALAGCATDDPSEYDIPCGTETRCRCNAVNCPNAALEKQVKNKTYDHVCTCVENPAGSGNWEWQCSDTSCQGSWSNAGTIPCSDWEKCTDTNWGSCSTDRCECSGECLASPENPKLYDYYGNEEIDLSDPENKATLPTRLGWDAVDGAQSYKYRLWKIDPPNITEWDDAIATSAGNAQQNWARTTSSSCLLQFPMYFSGDYIATSVNWQATPCCDANYQDCKEWSELGTPWFFRLSTAPQLISPADPDWYSTQEMAENTPLFGGLTWCNVKDADYYKLRIFQVEGGVTSCLPHFIGREGCENYEIIEKESSSKTSHFSDLAGAILSLDKEYSWEVLSCHLDYWGNEWCGECEGCTDFSQQWQFKTTNEIPGEGNILISPNNDPLGENPISPPVTLKWFRQTGMRSFLCEIIGLPVKVTSLSEETFYNLNLDETYQWRVKPCNEYGGICGDWSDTWTFKTGGAPPDNGFEAYPVDSNNRIIFPVNLRWDKSPGARSYKVFLEDSEGNETIRNTRSNTLSIDYPDLKVDTVYNWRVKSCIDDCSEVCGEFSSLQSFTTMTIGLPGGDISPADNSESTNPDKVLFHWDKVPGAKFYHYKIYDSVGDTIFNEKVSFNSFYYLPAEFPGNGFYEWEARACLDKNCVSDAGEWSPRWSFELKVEAAPSEQGGFVPCGRRKDDPTTPWAENEFCEIKHIFLLIRNILDFLLWQIATVLGGLIIAVLGLTIHFSLGDASITMKAKILMKSIIKGYLLIFLAWFAINVFLSLIGFKFGIFGHWYDFPL